MNGLPISLQLKGRAALLVGGGALALRKFRLLARTGADIIVVAPKLAGDWPAPSEETPYLHHSRAFAAGDITGRAMVISATGIDAVDNAVSSAARQAGIPVNVPDRPDLCTFHIPAIVDRGRVTVAIATDGAAPVLARRIRRDIEALLPVRIGALADFAARFRSAAASMVPAGLTRLRFWENVITGPIGAAVLAGREDAARDAMMKALNRPADQPDGGIVHIVGAGPGDPDLLTLKAHRLLHQADVIVYDNLVGDGILDLARRDAEFIFAGKQKGHHHKTQDEINALLVAEARLGKRVVRLKGGDPFVFGRGGEELACLRQAGIAAEIVPGITAATGCAASAEIPLTLRGTASAVTFLTGHGADGDPDLDWRALVNTGQTLVIYMGLAKIGNVTARLLENGADAETPAAVIENGTRAEERTVRGTLAALPALVEAHRITGPSIIVIGAVARHDTETRSVTGIAMQHAAAM